MKLIFAGQGETVQPFTNLLFNCTRNPKCQRAFYVPVNDFSDIVFYTDLPGSPTVTLIEVLNVCEIGNVGTAVSTQYVAGIKPDLSWYGVFGGLVVTPPVGVIYNRFFFRFTFTVGGEDYVYYSEQFEFPYCEDLMELKGCYPNEEPGVEAFDCNGIYYGYTTGEFLGDENFRYFHWAFLRMASVIEQRNKMSFTAFNNKRIYKTIFNREWLLEHEFVPTFYKDVLIGIYNRGNIRINGTEWKLAESQDISILDVDSKLWRMDMILDSECKQIFGCQPADCLPRVPPPDCVPVGFTPEIPTPVLPDGQVGVAYSYSFDIIGTPPFTLEIVSKPAWMTIAIVGSTVSFTGVPTEPAEASVNIIIRNCEDEFFISLENNFTVTNVCRVWTNDNEFNITIDYIDCNGDLVEGVTLTPTSSVCAYEITAQDAGTILEGGICDGGEFVVQSLSAQVNNITGITNTVTYPVLNTTVSAGWSAFTGGTINVDITTTAGEIRVYYNGVLQSVDPTTVSGIYPISLAAVGGGTLIRVEVEQF